MNKIFQTAKILILAVVLSFGLSYVLAWTAPDQAPPGGNIAAPVNTGSQTQVKSGNFYSPSVLDTSTSVQTKDGGLIINSLDLNAGKISGVLNLVAGIIISENIISATTTTSEIKFPDGTKQVSKGLTLKNSGIITNSTDWVKPLGVNFVTVHLVGGGGSGDNLTETSCFRGDPGAYVKKDIIVSKEERSFRITIGSRGQDVSTNWSKGVSGGPTTFRDPSSPANNVAADGGSGTGAKPGCWCGETRCSAAVPTPSSFPYDLSLGRGGQGDARQNNRGFYQATNGAVYIEWLE